MSRFLRAVSWPGRTGARSNPHSHAKSFVADCKPLVGTGVGYLILYENPDIGAWRWMYATGVNLEKI